VNLDGIAAPRCFEIERRLRQQLSIPVFHDDQHAVAVVVGAAVRNALERVGKALGSIRAVVSGTGASGTAVVRFLLALGVADVVVTTTSGILGPARARPLRAHERWLAEHSNPRGVVGDALAGVDVLVETAEADAVLAGPDALSSMAVEPIVLSLARERAALEAGVGAQGLVVATGMADEPDQLSGLLVSPGVFRGALDARARRVSGSMELAACDALGALARERGVLLPALLDPDVVPAVAARVVAAAGERHDPARALLEPVSPQ
jgi:malate dehydrogenase (oxaloacetate-decarboxylating)